MSTAKALDLDRVPNPPLRNGDVMSRDEFERRYADMPGAKAELIDGVVYLASPVFKDHSKPHTWILGWLATFDDLSDEYEVMTAHSVRPDADTEVQPDALIRKLEGGTSSYSAEGFIDGAPELAVEVSVSSVSRDLHSKLRAYQDAGVQEYIVWRVRDGELDWFELRDRSYVKREPDARGVIQSGVVPGLKLWVPALLAGRTVAVSDHLLGRIEAGAEG
jgi:Uma2 family endonuclease